MAKEIKFNTDVRSKMKSGADQLADAVKVTLVPIVEVKEHFYAVKLFHTVC